MKELQLISTRAERQPPSVTPRSGSNPIRHSGRALVRGKFRRVWRPRYLEVRDNGLLSYYECPPLTRSASLDVFVDPSTMADVELVDEQDDQYHAKVPKCNLWIHHARVIDPTTLRDMHVGLPRGAYGFLFHGQKVDEDEGDLLQLYISMGQVCQGSTTDSTPRDFLCAVDSLEEAQSWVVALQWAASMGRDNSFHGASTLHYAAPSGTTLSNNVSWDHQDVVLSASSSSCASTQQQLQVKPESASMSPARSDVSDSPNKRKQSSIDAASSSSGGKMVVTKVVGYTLVRVETWKWEIAYRIQVLLVMPTKQQQQQVQEWSILRTAQNLQLIVDKLKVSLPSATTQQLHLQIERIRLLPELQTLSRRPLTELVRSLSSVDSILRSFCMEATVVNSSVVKRFLGVHLNASESMLQKSFFWDIHNSTGLRTPPKRTILHQTIDQYVKQWLQQRPKENEVTPDTKFRALCWYLSLPQPATTYVGAALMVLWLSSSTLPTVNRFIEKFQILPYVSVRIDALIISWLVAAGLGHSWTGAPSRPLARTPNSGCFNGYASGQKMAPAQNTVQASPAKSTNCQENERGKPTTSKSFMDEEEIQDVSGEDDGEEGNVMNDTADTPNDGGGHTVKQRASFLQKQDSRLSSPLPQHSTAEAITESCWSTPKARIFHVRGRSYLTDRVKVPSGDASFTCRGVDMWMTDNPERHIARHPSVLGGQLANTDQDMFLVNFLLPFGNFVSYFSVPPLEKFANPQLAGVWSRFIQGDQQYRDARLKLLPVVVDGPWIVRAAVPGASPALLGKVIPLQYFVTQRSNGRSIYEVDVIITASSIAKGILSVVKGHAKALSIAFAFIIEAAEEHELPETVLASFQVNSLHLEDCPLLPDCNLDAF